MGIFSTRSPSALQTRFLIPEILDSLPPDDPAAAAGRRDLRRINRIMGNHRWIARELLLHEPGGMIVELGAGDGLLARRICQAQPGIASRYHALDLAPRPADWPAEAHWHQLDLWSPDAAALLQEARTVVANLFLHHLDNDALHRLGAILTNCELLIASEPARRRRHCWQGMLLFPLLHRITRHDMLASIRAGFLKGELPRLLGLHSPPWRVHSHLTQLGACRITARRLYGPASSS